MAEEKGDEDEKALRKRRLDDIEEAAMIEQDPEKLNNLFKEYRQEYLKDRSQEEEGEGKRRRLQDIEDEVLNTGASKRAGELYGEYMREYKKQKQAPAQLQEAASSSTGPPRFEEPGPSIDIDRTTTSTEHGHGPRMDIGQIVTNEWSKKDELDEKKCHEYAWDDVHDRELPLDKVRAARREEIQYMKGTKFKVVKKSEALEVTGRHPISTKWVDTDKNHGIGDPAVRCRWVARDFKPQGEKDREDLFCATPPLELLRFALSRQATRRKDGLEKKTLFLDVKKAHLVAKCDEDVHVVLPAEAEVEEDECGTLIYWLYGCRRAGQAWEDHYAKVLMDEGFRRAASSPVVFHHKERDVLVVVHGDDFVINGVDGELDKMLVLFRENFEIKDRGRLGGGRADVQEIDILGRIVRRHDWGVSWEADDRHRQIVLDYFGLDEGSKALVKNGYKEDAKAEGESESVGLGPEECRAYRALAARVNYIAQDNPCIQCSAKEICRHMANPAVEHFAKIKKLARFMVGVKSARLCYAWQSEAEALHMKIYVDSDWAGCTETRKSTSGGLAQVGRHTLRAWSSTQTTVATSSAEAEFYAMVEGASRGLGLRSMLGELGVVTGVVELHTDSSAAKSFASRRGLGKMRHVDIKFLWLQESVKLGNVRVQ